MSTILISDNEFTIVKNIFNSIVQRNNEVKIIGISGNGKEALNKFNFNKNSSAYKYLKDAIYLIIYEGINNFEWEKDIYKKVAKINNKKNE